MKKMILFLLLSLLINKSNAQSAIPFQSIDFSEDQIKAQMENEEGILKLDKFVMGFSTPSRWEMEYQFPKGISENADIYFVKFFLSRHDKLCFQYDIWYRNDRSLKKLTDQLNDPRFGWKKAGNDLKWVNANNLKIEILRPETKKGTKTTAFVFQMEKIK